MTRVFLDDWNILQMLIINLTGYVNTKLFLSLTKPIRKHHTYTNASFKNLQILLSFNFPLGYFNVTGKSSRIFYKNLIESFVSLLFSINTVKTILNIWWGILAKYLWMQVLRYTSKHITEFSYKILNNTLCNNVIVIK